MTDYFLVKHVPGPRWDHTRRRREQAAWDEHAAFMDGLTEEGLIFLGGPVGSGDGDYFPEQQIFGQSIVAVKQNPQTKALEMTDWYAPSNAVWLRKRDLDMNATGPVFDFKGKEYTVQTSKECRLWLLDTSALGGEDHRTPVYRTPLVCNEEVQFAGAGVWGALSTWEEPNGTRWILMPFWGPRHSKFTAPIEHGQISHGAIASCVRP